MKIVLVLLCEFYARNKNGGFLLKNRIGAYAPTTLITLASLIPSELNAQVEIYDEFIENFNPHKVSADLVGISFTTPNANYAYELSEILRNRKITVVLGGYHVSLLPEEASLHADSCVIGFAEKSWPQLLRDFDNNNLQPLYNSSYKEEFQNLRVNRYDLVKKRKYFLSQTLEYSRNCNNHCDFCVISALYGGQYTHRNLINIKRDVSVNNFKNIVFMDSNVADDLDSFSRLCEVLRELDVKWQAAISFKNIANKEVVKMMALSGCQGVLVGFESVCQQSLNSHNKGFNRIDRYYDVIKAIHKYKMYILGTFVLGLDEDDTTIFDATIDFVNKSKIDVVYFNTLIPFPGTELFNTLENQNRILTKDWSKYDGKHVVYQPQNMSDKELMIGLKKVYRETYSFSSIARRTLFTSCFSLTNFIRNVALGVYSQNVLKFKHG